MRLYFAPTSPFARKCAVTAHELGIIGRIELLTVATTPVQSDQSLLGTNPLGKVPTLITDDGLALYDSRVICEYLNALSGAQLLPSDSPAHWRARLDEALADGIMDAAVLARYEIALRPAQFQWKEWLDGQMGKVTRALIELERRAAALGRRVDCGTIALGCALGYLDLRYAALGWRQTYPATALWFDEFNRRPSMQATRPGS